MNDTRKGVVKQKYVYHSTGLASLLIEQTEDEGANWYFTGLENVSHIKVDDRVKYKETGYSMPDRNGMDRVPEIDIL